MYAVFVIYILVNYYDIALINICTIYYDMFRLKYKYLEY